MKVITIESLSNGSLLMSVFISIMRYSALNESVSRTGYKSSFFEFIFGFWDTFLSFQICYNFLLWEYGGKYLAIEPSEGTKYG